jgi:hypothetical protein
MNLDELQNDWNSPRNDLPTEQQRKLAEQFVLQMRRRRRFQLWWLIHTFFWLTVITVLAARTVALGRTGLGQEWALLPLLTVPWLFAFHFLRRFLKPVLPVARGELSVIDSLRAALAANRAEQSHLKKVGVLFAIMIPLLALSMSQLRSTHKVSSSELTSMAVFLGGILLLSGAGIAARYFARVLPRQREIKDLLTELTSEPR